jgi:hypothetical protein
MPSMTTVGMDKLAAAELRQARRDMSAQAHRDLTVSEVVRALVAAWRQLSANGGRGPGVMDSVSP